MTRRIWTILVSLALIGCFFLAFFRNGNFSISAYDIVFKTPGGEGQWEKYIWLLIPLSSILLLIGALNNGHYFISRTLFCWTPLFTVIFIIVRWYLLQKEGNEIAGFGDFIKTIGEGLWATLGLSLLLSGCQPAKIEMENSY